MARTSLRNMPSPLQGASTTIKSKRPSNAEKADGSLRVTTWFTCPHLAIFSAKTLARDLMTSLLTSKPLPAKKADIRVLLPPGAPHKSSKTGSSGSRSSNCFKIQSNTILLASCDSKSRHEKRDRGCKPASPANIFRWHTREPFQPGQNGADSLFEDSIAARRVPGPPAPEKKAAAHSPFGRRCDCERLPAK